MIGALKILSCNSRRFSNFPIVECCLLRIMYSIHTVYISLILSSDVWNWIILYIVNLSNQYRYNYSIIIIDCLPNFNWNSKFLTFFWKLNIHKRNLNGSLYFRFLIIYEWVILKFKAVFDQWDFFVFFLFKIIEISFIDSFTNTLVTFLSQQFFNLSISRFCLKFSGI